MEICMVVMMSQSSAVFQYFSIAVFQYCSISVFQCVADTLNFFQQPKVMQIVCTNESLQILL